MKCRRGGQWRGNPGTPEAGAPAQRAISAPGPIAPILKLTFSPATLVWLSGMHVPSAETRPPDVNRESVEASKTFEIVRDSPQTKSLLRILKKSKNRWIQEYAILVSAG